MGLKTKRNDFVLRLEYSRSLLYEIHSSAITGDITIGRDSSCTWLLPTEDHSASSRHAVITVKRTGIYIEDTKSRNGIYFNGERISTHRLAIGDQLGIGECKLFVERPYESSKVAAGNNQLELLNGPRKGMIYDLNKELFRIGSASDCDLVFNDNVVSHIHAQIEQKADGSCWIRDCCSRNGTKVNNVPLASDNNSGRMLQDGDIITISYLELRFLDKHVVHVRSHWVGKTITVVLTIAVVLGGYFFFQAVSPSAKIYIDVARRYAARHNFQKAREYLEKAGNARGAETHTWERAELSLQVDQWESTIAKWKLVQEHLSKKRWITANEILSPLLSENMELWRWNDEDANESKMLATACKQLIDAFLEARTTMEDADVTLAKMDFSLENLGNELKNSPSQAPAFLKLLQSFAKDIYDELALVRSEQVKINGMIADPAKLEHLDFVIEELGKMKKEAEQRAATRRKKQQRYSTKTQKVCEELLLPMSLMLEAQKCLEKNYTAAATFQFDALTKRLPLPTPAQCSSSPVLSDKRRELELRNEACLNHANQLRNIIATLKSHQLEPGQTPACIEMLSNKEIMDKVFACDSLDFPVAKWDRTASSGEYDRVLGIEIFYEYLRALPEQFDSGLLDGRSFIPELFQARTAFGYLEDFLTFAAKKEMSRIRNAECDDNKLSKFTIYADELLLQREELVVKMKEQYMQQPGRKAIIAGGMALLLAHNTQMLPDDFSEEVAAKFRQLRKEILAVTTRDATPEEAVRNKRTLLEIGLPGDPLLKQPWAERKN